MRTAGGHRRISREELMHLAKECGVEWASGSSTSLNDNIQRIVVFDLELDFAEMVAEFLNLQEGMSATSVDSLVDVGFALGSVRPDVLLCTDEIGMISLGRILRCAGELRTHVIVTTNGPGRNFDSPGLDREPPDIVEKPLKLDALLKTISAQ